MIKYSTLKTTSQVAKETGIHPTRIMRLLVRREEVIGLRVGQKLCLIEEADVAKIVEILKQEEKQRQRATKK